MVALTVQAPAAASSLSAIRHWVFDMDGTLTVAVHDFARIKRELAIPQEDDILIHLAGLPAAEAGAKHAWLLAHERALAAASQPATGAVALVRALQGAGCRLGILTRNDHALAKLTLDAIGVGELFDDADIIGRDEAVPKPSPDGLQQHLRRWGIAPAQAVMVGDHAYDLECGRAAGTHTVLVNLPENPWPGRADWHFADCRALLAAWQQRG
ncbi:HAD family hydrolase [Stenotrophomonas sp. C1657]|uniref:HAD family hydrolase n=1 Tax=Stenotrophomonas sp. C1657 TaxID=3077844 RepID=UPI00293CA971|nr:HAD family hydrolase [Stenotrophomonas sp. C1657]MDV3516069.1 HAD family hydrolase [Stenotrophomonas sp. C1657]